MATQVLPTSKFAKHTYLVVEGELCYVVDVPYRGHGDYLIENCRTLVVSWIKPALLEQSAKVVVR